MNPTELAVQLDDINSPMCRDALSRKCEVCRASVGVPCHNLTDGGPLKPRRVHLMRTVAA